MVVHPTDAAFRRFVRLIQAIEIALLTTVDRDGHLHARPLQTLGVGPDRTLWFFTDLRSEKVFELERDVRLSLGYADPRGRRYVALGGTGRLLRDPDKARELWSVEQRAYYPTGPQAEHLVLLKVQAERAEYWLAPGKTAHMLAALKARISGIPAGILGENHRIP
ncbi:MAG: pyridoxamine 5'-phosphate oxidase family protein [Gammaproteobacteria bacterium]|nr:pyridoxamine 5'-phosphate oxidase family protein [Gammaproteobacteria bacterium]